MNVLLCFTQFEREVTGERSKSQNIPCCLQTALPSGRVETGPWGRHKYATRPDGRRTTPSQLPRCHSPPEPERVRPRRVALQNPARPRAPSRRARSHRLSCPQDASSA
ncbi:MAG: hypothetical protein CVT82_14720 [Alphaproteobacteria bacterium HGW-Alphaproteobacteria-4]|nr:MAG: hypothetical protein CVT82_14720 [Alphaproteobacteria bacterium HGW-Alphaproteobacteria-4]